VRIDVPAMIARKNKIVRGLASGVSTLFAKNKVVSFAGKGRLLPGMRVEVTPLGGGPIETIEAKNISSPPARCPGYRPRSHRRDQSWSIPRARSTSRPRPKSWA
jgi:hypothetical protein